MPACSACAILVTFAMALALFFSALNVFFRDFQNIVETIMQFMHFLVPMMYPFSLVWAAHDRHPVLYQIYVANPVTQAVLLLQRFFWYPLIEDPSDLGRSSRRTCASAASSPWRCACCAVAGPEVLLAPRGQVPGAALR